MPRNLSHLDIAVSPELLDQLDSWHNQADGATSRHASVIYILQDWLGRAAPRPQHPSNDDGRADLALRERLARIDRAIAEIDRALAAERKLKFPWLPLLLIVVPGVAIGAVVARLLH